MASRDNTTTSTLCYREGGIGERGIILYISFALFSYLTISILDKIDPVNSGPNIWRRQGLNSPKIGKLYIDTLIIPQPKAYPFMKKTQTKKSHATVPLSRVTVPVYPNFNHTEVIVIEK